MTSDFKYFKSVISVMVSNTVEALIFPQSPRSPRVVVLRPDETYTSLSFRLRFRVMLTK